MEKFNNLHKKLANICDSRKSAVCGWIRRAEMELSLQHTPSMISAICIIYTNVKHSRDLDFFEYCGGGMQVSEDKRTITSPSKPARPYDRYPCGVAFGVKEISGDSNCICQWDFKVHQINEEYKGFVCLGIQDSIDLTGREPCFSFMYNLNGKPHEDPREIAYVTIDANGQERPYHEEKENEHQVMVNDIISLRLDFTEKRAKLTYQVNDEEKVYNNKYHIDKRAEDKWRLHVELVHPSNRVELINFSKKEL